MTRAAERLAALLRWGLVPSAPVGAACAAGFASEVVLLAASRAGILHQGALLAAWALAVLAWLWITTGWAIHLATHLVRGPRAARVAWLALVSLIGIALALLHALSWGMFFRIDVFATFDMLWLVGPFLSGADPKMLSLILVEAKRGAPLIALVAIGIPVLVALAARADAGASAAAALRTWLRVTLGVAVATLGVAAATGQARAHWELARRGVDPTVTFALTGLERLRGDGLRPCLDPAELVERAPRPAPPPPRDRRSVLFIKVESLRADTLLAEVGGVPVMPNARKLAAEARHFTRAYGPATHSDYADTSVHTSHYAALGMRRTDYGANPRWPRVTLATVLKELGWETGYFASGDLTWCAMDAVLRQGVDEFQDYWTSKATAALPMPDDGPDLIDDAVTTSAAIKWIEGRKGPFLVTVDLQSAHFPYVIPKAAPRIFAPSLEEPGKYTFIQYPVDATPAVLNAYRNALHYADEQIGRLIASLAASGRLDDTIVALWSDHGEMFHEIPGFVTHSREPFEGAARVAVLLRAPGLVAPGTDDDPVESIDLVPTLCGRLGVPRHPSFQGVDLLGPERPPRAERFAFVTCDMVVHADAVVVAGRWKLMKDRDSGRERFFDLASDPQEKAPLEDAASRERQVARAVLREWRDRQYAYYGYPSYYERYWPPPPPRLALFEGR